MKRRDGFTLAEVLITLTIIGVISALTLPAIQSNTAATRNRAALKKAMGAITQAAQANIAANGWNFAQIDADDDAARGVARASQNARDHQTIFALLNSSLSGETNIDPDNPPEGYNLPSIQNASSAWFATYQLNDGSIIGLNLNVSNCTESKRRNGVVEATWCGGYIDVNGPMGPSREITCSDGSRTYLWANNGDDATCQVERTTNADVFPIVFYDNTVELASDAARAFLRDR